MSSATKSTRLSTEFKSELAAGTILVIAPHMDDAVIGCGGTLAQLATKENIHIAYATDGSKSPIPELPGAEKSSQTLCSIRTQEAREALKILGIPSENISFLNFPDGALKSHHKQFCQTLSNLIQRIQPDQVFVPFRYDWHPDHLAVSTLTTQVIHNQELDIEIFEYFIYYRSQLLPKKDVRQYIRPEYIVTSNIQSHGEQKRASLSAFESQMTLFYSWQDRPVISDTLVNEVCSTPELFLRASELTQQRSPFPRKNQFIPLITKLEPRLKKIKTQTLFLVKTIMELPTVLRKTILQ